MKKQFTLTAIASLLSLSLAVFWKQPVQSTTALPDREINVTLIGDSYSSGNGAGITLASKIATVVNAIGPNFMCAHLLTKALT